MLLLVAEIHATSPSFTSAPSRNEARDASFFKPTVPRADVIDASHGAVILTGPRLGAVLGQLRLECRRVPIKSHTSPG